MEEKLDTVGNLEEDESRLAGDSEEEETDLRGQQEVGEMVKAECLALSNRS